MNVGKCLNSFSTPYFADDLSIGQPEPAFTALQQEAVPDGVRDTARRRKVARMASRMHAE